MKRKGFVMIYALASIAVCGLLSAAAAFTVSQSFTREKERDRSLDETLIAQDVMEREKYNHRFGGEPSFGSETERNGKRYEISVTRRPRMVEGIPMVEISCLVHGEGSEGIRLSTLLEER